MEFVAIYNGHTVFKDCKENFVVEGCSSIFITEVEAFKACMGGKINGE